MSHQSSCKDFESKSKTTVFQKKLEFYYTLLLRLCKILESETKSWSKILPDLELTRTLATSWTTYMRTTKLHLRSLIRIFGVRMKKPWVLSYPLSEWARSKDSNQTGWMPRLIWVFAGRICHFVGFVMRRLIYRCPFTSVMIVQIVISAFWCSMEMFILTSSFIVRRPTSFRMTRFVLNKTKHLLCIFILCILP